MDKHEFLVILRRKLKKLDESQITAAINYYENYFNEFGDSFEVVSKLDDPRKIVSAIVSSHAINILEKEIEDKEKINLSTSFKTAKLVNNAIFTYPISLVSKIGIFFLLIILITLYLVLIFCFWLVCFSLFISGVAGIVSGFGVITQGLSSAFLAIGVGCFLSGFGLFSSVFFPVPIKKITNIVFISFTKWCGRKMADLNKLEGHVRGFINEKIKK